MFKNVFRNYSLFILLFGSTLTLKTQTNNLDPALHGQATKDASPLEEPDLAPKKRHKATKLSSRVKAIIGSVLGISSLLGLGSIRARRQERKRTRAEQKKIAEAEAQRLAEQQRLAELAARIEALPQTVRSTMSERFAYRKGKRLHGPDFLSDKYVKLEKGFFAETDLNAFGRITKQGVIKLLESDLIPSISQHCAINEKQMQWGFASNTSALFVLAEKGKQPIYILKQTHFKDKMQEAFYLPYVQHYYPELRKPIRFQNDQLGQLKLAFYEQIFEYPNPKKNDMPDYIQLLHHAKGKNLLDLLQDPAIGTDKRNEIFKLVANAFASFHQKLRINKNQPHELPIGIQIGDVQPANIFVDMESRTVTMIDVSELGKNLREQRIMDPLLFDKGRQLWGDVWRFLYTTLKVSPAPSHEEKRLFLKTYFSNFPALQITEDYRSKFTDLPMNSCPSYNIIADLFPRIQR